MQLTLVRNATLILDYAGTRILVDPYLAPRYAFPSFTGASQNPTVDLPLPVANITQGVDAVLITHLHTDHFDSYAQDAINKAMRVGCQPGDAAKIREMGFTAVAPVDDTITW
ncbi:MAG: MBL fold metallo-hydrolase, partial [Chloroflexota bacterium]